MDVSAQILEKIHQYENAADKVAFSRKHPSFKKPVIFLRQAVRNAQNLLDFRIKAEKGDNTFPYIVARHQSVLRRKLGDSDQRLQEQKIINLRQAIKKIDGLIIKPGKIFSLWKNVGKPKYEDGFVDGMLLSGGKVIEGLGGGLCQLSNFLFWIFLHAPTKIIERHHHSMDVFPDSGRILPFGSGATILYNYKDLKIKNISPNPLQIKIWLTGEHLKGCILSPVQIAHKFSVKEKNHFFIKRDDKYFRFNELFRETQIQGMRVNTEKISTNFAPVLYDVTEEYLRANNFKTLIFSYE